MGALLNYLHGFLDPTQPDKSLRHAAFAAVMASGIVWLSVDMGVKQMGARRGIDANWVTAFGLLLAAATGAKLGGEKKVNPDKPMEPQ